MSTIVTDRAGAAEPGRTGIVRDALAVQVRRFVGHKLCSGAWKPGDRITMRALAQELGISTTPVREVLLQLAATGCLELKQNTSFSVPAMTLEAYLETRRLRVLLEGEAAAVAAEGAPDAAVDALAAIHGRLIVAERDRDVPACLEHNQAFHLTLAEISGLSTLFTFVETLWLRSGPMLNVLFPRTQPWERGISRHLDLIAGLRARNPERARAAIQNDIIEGGPLIEAALRAGAGEA